MKTRDTILTSKGTTSIIPAAIRQAAGLFPGALDRASQADELGISTVTYAEPASGARTREHVDVTNDHRRTNAWAGLDWIWP